MSDQVDQSVESDDTSVVEESTSQVEASGAESQESAPEVKQEEKIGFNDPKHPDHTRFKELLDGQREYKQRFEDAERERATYRQSVEAMQRELQALRQQATPKPEKVKDPFLADLEKVNPEYARSLQSVYDRAAKAEQIEARLQQYEQQQFAEKAYNHFGNLLSTNKITNPMDQELYRNVVEAEVYRREGRGEKLGIKDLDTIFTQFHSKYAKAMEERDRSITAKYVTAKKSDSAPKGATGGAATAPVAKKMAAGDIAGQAKWLADQIRSMKKTI